MRSRRRLKRSAAVLATLDQEDLDLVDDLVGRLAKPG